MDDILAYLSHLTGLQPATLILLGGIIVTVSNAVSRAIPDDATGFLRFLRAVTKLVGVNVSSRLTSGISVSDVGRALLQTPDSKEQVEQQLKMTGVLPDGRGIAGITRDARGKFQKLESPWFVTLLVFGLVAMLFSLGGCADKDVIKTVCSRQMTIRSIANAALKEAYLIPDPLKQRLAVDAANHLLDSIANCAPVGSPASIGGM